jgi:hypothetical protein
MDAVTVRLICGVVAVVLLAVIVLRRRSKDQRESENS